MLQTPTLAARIISGRFLFVIIVSAFATVSFAQDSATMKNKWHYVVEPYVMFPNMNGTVGVGNLPNADVDENPGDIFSHLQFGAMLYLEAHNDHWASAISRSWKTDSCRSRQ